VVLVDDAGHVAERADGIGTGRGCVRVHRDPRTPGRRRCSGASLTLVQA
jgi:hypothetical protein